MATKTVLPPYPNGWYAICASSELAAGKIHSKRLFGKDLVLYRTASGQAVLADAFCPHLGAHFAHGGKVLGEQLQCPFHFFEFDPNGTCSKTGYGSKVPPKCKLKTYTIEEKNGFILVWQHHAEEEPNFRVPEQEFSNWTEPLIETFTLSSHPQETTENLVDLGHFVIVHGYENVEIFEPLQREGPYAWAEYGMLRPRAALGQKNVKARFKAHAWGLGFSFVEARVPKYDLQTRLFVLPTPIEENKLQLTIALSLQHIEKPSKIHPLLALLPRKLVHKIIAQQAFKAYKHDVQQDFAIWENKTYVHPPVLAQGDGPVWQYREWAEQFYKKEELEAALGRG